MSLTKFVARPEVREKLKPFRPKLPRKIPAPLKVEPMSNRYSMVGTAFDYLLRFEIKRRAPHAMTEPWVAEQAPDLIWKATDTGDSIRCKFDWLDYSNIHHAFCLHAEMAKRAREIVEDAKAAVAAYLKLRRPNRANQADLAAHAIRLAKLDCVLRVRMLDQRFEEADPEDVKDLLNLLAIAPWDSLLHDKVLLLNPTFGQTSGMADGADADLITGDMLVDFKTTKRSEMQLDDLDQLFGYYLLARHQRRVDPTFPKINRLALYFCRHGHLWIVDTTTWMDNPQFSEVEAWFFKRAKEVFGHA